MFMAHDVKALMLPSTVKMPTGSVPDRSLMISYQTLRARLPKPDRHAHAGHSQHCSGDPTKAEIRKFLAKKDSEAYPIVALLAGKRISGLPRGCVRRALAHQLHKLRHEVGKKKREDGGQDGKR
jgi:hypothetical protein